MDLVPIDTHEPIKDRMYSSFSPNARFLTTMAESKMELLLGDGGFMEEAA